MPRKWYETLCHPKMNVNTKFRFLPLIIADMLQTRIFYKTSSEVKVNATVSRKWYGTLRNFKMHPHLEFGIPTSKNVGDMHRTQSGQKDSAIAICLPKLALLEHSSILLTCISVNSILFKYKYIKIQTIYLHNTLHLKGIQK